MGSRDVGEETLLRLAASADHLNAVTHFLEIGAR